ncbi:MAG: hypothetical protein AB7G13_07240 [Lautropia sp.]
MKPTARRWLAVMWPAFVAACALEMVVFAAFDPDDFHGFGAAVDWSRETVLTVAFIVFWVITSFAGYVTWRLAETP